jgi:hypothetical protein
MIRKKLITGHYIIDLTGPQGNAWVLLGYARDFGRQLKFDTGTIHKEMTSGDYENLVNVFDKYFGNFVILER